MLIGNTGTGKTHLAVSILKHVLTAGSSGCYATVQGALRQVKDTWGREESARHGDVMRRFTKPDLLVLDEVGVQFGTDAERIILFDMLNERYNHMLPTLLISNLPKQDVAQFLGDRIVDRMRENGGKLIVFGWDSYRSRRDG
jgi:DNA replication protein DnaC